MGTPAATASSRTTMFAVTRYEEAGPVAAYIPTLGFATSASDMYRVERIVETGHAGWNSCYTDVATCSALARLVESEIRTIQDLEAAEVGLQILMWHDRVDVLVPAFKFYMDKLVSYARADQPRSRLAFDLFAPCAPQDAIFAVERVEVVTGVISQSTLSNSSLTGRIFQDAKADYLQTSPIQAATLANVPMYMGVPAYFTDPAIESFTGKRGFFGKFYSDLSAQWEQRMSVVPDIDVAIPLPPLLAIVLTRARTRDDIPKAIIEVRDELAAVRREMLRLNEVVQGAGRQKDIEEQVNEAQKSFAAALPASRRPPVSFLFPLLKLYKAARTPLDALMKVLNPNYSPEDPRIVANRTITGRVFSELLNTDSMHSLVSHFFTEAEKRNLEISRAQSRNHRDHPI
ncbi:MAG: hypothetical protein ACREX3_12975, partial [Gammaproteobacteria bacterium]